MAAASQLTAEGAWASAREHLQGYGPAEPVRFVDDRRVAYDASGEIRVPRGELFRLDDERWRWFLSPAPSWLHFDLLDVGADGSLVTVRRGADLAADSAGSTSVNVSSSYGGERRTRTVLIESP